jgi:hypothetical protein
VPTGVLLLPLFALLSSCGPAVPSAPTYEADVRPIFLARCVRCHSTGGPGPDGGQAARSAVSPYLDHYEDQNCANGSLPSDCQRGALSTVMIIAQVIHSSDPTTTMPPPPSSLDGWQISVLDRWTKNPICSNAPNPDPAVCPPDAGS